MSNWCRIDAAYFLHPKTLRLCALLGDPDADRYMPRIWAWAAGSCPSGVLDARIARTMFEGIARWHGEPGRLFACLVEVGFVDLVGGTTALLHDWAVINGYALREQKRKTEAKWRETDSARAQPRADMRALRTDGRTDVQTEAEKPSAETPDAPVLPLFPLARSPASTGEVPPVSRKPPRAADPRHAPLVEALTEAFRKTRGAAYAFDGGKDARAVSRLLRFAPTNEEIVDRWQRALVARYPACSSIAVFAANWNAYAAPPGPKPMRFV